LSSTQVPPKFAAAALAASTASPNAVINPAIKNNLLIRKILRYFVVSLVCAIETLIASSVPKTFRGTIGLLFVSSDARCQKPDRQGGLPRILPSLTVGLLMHLAGLGRGAPEGCQAIIQIEPTPATMTLPF